MFMTSICLSIFASSNCFKYIPVAVKFMYASKSHYSMIFLQKSSGSGSKSFTLTRITRIHPDNGIKNVCVF